jgi:hypothetical protein
MCHQLIADIVDALAAVDGGNVELLYLSHHSTAEIVSARACACQYQLGHTDAGAFVTYALVLAAVNYDVEIVRMFEHCGNIRSSEAF